MAEISVKPAKDTSRELFSEEAEAAVVGALIINPDLYPDVASNVGADDFYFIKNRNVFIAITALYQQQMSIDNVTIVEYLRTAKKLNEIGGSYYITQLINDVPNHVHAPTYAKLVYLAALRRRYVEFAQHVAKGAMSPEADIETFAAELNEVYRDLSLGLRSRSMVSGGSMLDKIWESFNARCADPAEVRGLSCGIHALDKTLGGFRPGLYAVGGASSMGKSTFAGMVTYNFARMGRGLLVPTEVSGARSLEKIATDLAGIPYKRYLSGFLSNDEAERFSDAFGKLYAVRENITICDSTRPNIQEIQAEIRRTNAKWLIVDSGTAMSYQNMGTAKAKLNDLRTNTTAICQALQDIGRDGVCVLALWQTGRNAKARTSKLPQINDFKESGSVEETADVCLGLYRHDYYVDRGEAQPDLVKYPRGTAKILVLKDRDGGAGDDAVTVGFRPGHGFTAHVVGENGR